MSRWKKVLAKTLYFIIPAFLVNLYLGVWDNTHGGTLSDFATFVYWANGWLLLVSIIATVFALGFPEED